MILVVSDPETGSTTSVGGETTEECLIAAIKWLGANFYWMDERRRDRPDGHHDERIIPAEDVKRIGQKFLKRLNEEDAQ